VKPEADTLLTVPTVPPAAGPDRALDPPPADAGPLVAGLVVAGVEALLEAAAPLEVAATIP
jgi:hypothetical protein